MRKIEFIGSCMHKDVQSFSSCQMMHPLRTGSFTPIMLRILQPANDEGLGSLSS